MATVPNIRRLLLEDFPDQAEWIEKLLQPLNSYMEQSAAALKALTVNDNMAGAIKTVELDGVFPVRVAWSGPKPVSVLVGNVTRSDQTTSTTVLSTTGTSTSGSNSVTSVASTTGIKQGLLVTGTGIPDDTHVVSILGSTLTLSKNATASTTGGDLLFSVDQAVQVIWEYDQSGSLSISAVTGISPTVEAKYKLVLECKAG